MRSLLRPKRHCLPQHRLLLCRFLGLFAASTGLRPAPWRNSCKGSLRTLAAAATISRNVRNISVPVLELSFLVSPYFLRDTQQQKSPAPGVCRETGFVSVTSGLLALCN